MTVKEFYEEIHGDYDDIMERLFTDELILHFVKRFPSDITYAQLMEAVQKADIKASFEATHKLKGVAANLAFSDLFAALNDLSEQLRSQTEPANPLLVQKVSECYNAVLSEINCLKEGEFY